MSSYIWITDLAEVWVEVIHQSLPRSWECHSTEEEDQEHQVGERSCEVHYLQTKARLGCHVQT